MSTARTQFTNGPNVNTYFVVVTSDASYSVDIADRYLLVTGTGSPATAFTLPTGTLGEVHFFKDASTSTSTTFTITASGGQTIDGDASINFGGRQAIGIIFDGVAWRVFTTNSPRTPADLILVAGLFNTGSTTPTRVGGRLIDLTQWVNATSTAGGSFATTVAFKANIETTAGTANVRLFNVTDNETVTGTALTTTNTTNTEVTGSVTLGSSAGNLKSGKLYEVDIFITGGGGTDRTTCTNARLVFTYS